MELKDSCDCPKLIADGTIGTGIIAEQYVLPLCLSVCPDMSAFEFLYRSNYGPHDICTKTDLE